MSTKKIATVGMLTALYVVLSLTLKIPLGVGAIALDLGYIVLTVSAFKVGVWSAVVGGAGAAIESFMFSPYGLSYGWIVMNIIIGLICGYLLYKTRRSYAFHICTIVFAVLAGITAKTIIECSLYSIPYPVKLPKSATAFAVDTIVMLIGLIVVYRLKIGDNS